MAGASDAKKRFGAGDHSEWACGGEAPGQHLVSKPTCATGYHSLLNKITMWAVPRPCSHGHLSRRGGRFLWRCSALKLGSKRGTQRPRRQCKCLNGLLLQTHVGSGVGRLAARHTHTCHSRSRTTDATILLATPVARTHEGTADTHCYRARLTRSLH